MKILLAAATLLLLPNITQAQTLALASTEAKANTTPFSMPRKGSSGRGDFNNEVKINLLSAVMGNITLQYERALTPNLAAGLSVRVGPERGLPFASTLKSVVGNDTVSDKLLPNARFSNYAITPEIRYYFGSQNISGFYLGFFGRFGSYSLDLPYTIKDPGLPNGQQDVLLKGKYNYGGGGLQIGAKFNLSNRVTLDWAFFGPMFTSGNLSLDAQTDMSNVTADGKEQTRQELRQNFDNVEVDNNVVRVSRALPLPGIRTALSIGFRF